MYKLGDTLKNGAVVLAISEHRVLAFRGHEFAVWRIDADGYTYSGRYTRDIAEAVKDFTR